MAGRAPPGRRRPKGAWQLPRARHPPVRRWYDAAEPGLVPARTRDWIDLANRPEERLDSSDGPPFAEVLAELHNTFECVHPFIDGNGRASRLALAAEEAFAEFLDGERFTVDQVRFVGLIVEELTANGVMEPGRLFESPFTDHAPTGPDSVFRARDVDGIVEILRNVRSTALADAEAS